MLDQIKSSILWAKIVRAYKNGRYKDSKILISKYKNKYSSNSVVNAFDATLDILNNNSSLALEKFTEICNHLENIVDNEDARYIENYSKYYICLIKKEGKCDFILEEAVRSSASKSVKKWLQFPDEYQDLS